MRQVVNLDVEVDLNDFSTSDLIEELQDRGEFIADEEDVKDWIKHQFWTQEKWDKFVEDLKLEVAMFKEHK